MPIFRWALEPIAAVRAFEARFSNPSAGALIMWGTRCVDTLHYLDDLDQALSETPPYGHNLDLVDVAHARWAAGTSITALDLCAAALGRVFCHNSARNEFALVAFDPSTRDQRVARRRSELPASLIDWVDSVLGDPRYRLIKDSRDWLTHSRVLRHFSMGTPGRRRLDLEIGGTRTNVRRLVEDARDVATKHIESFLILLPGL